MVRPRPTQSGSFMASEASTAAPPRGRDPWRVAWIGGDDGVELAWARDAAATVARVHGLTTPDGAWQGSRPPTVVALAAASPGHWRLDDVVALAARWPLAAIVAVGGTLGDGGRRSGPRLPGIEEIPWHEFPHRLTSWLAELDAGRAGSLGSPPAARREDRVLLAAVAAARTRAAGPRLRLSIAGPDAVAAEGLADLATALGHEVVGRRIGRPTVADAASALVWEVAAIDATVLVWLRLLAAERPERPILLVEGFPRSDTTLQALDAGAAAVLGRPLALETLGGALLRHAVARPALGER
jgi:hypothetical protein